MAFSHTFTLFFYLVIIIIQTPLFEKVRIRSFKGSKPVICKGSTPCINEHLRLNKKSSINTFLMNFYNYFGNFIPKM